MEEEGDEDEAEAEEDEEEEEEDDDEVADAGNAPEKPLGACCAPMERDKPAKPNVSNAISSVLWPCSAKGGSSSMSVVSRAEETTSQTAEEKMRVQI